MSDSSSGNGGIGLAGLFGILFTGLKLGHVIDWSWWWVLSPFWVSASVAIVALTIVAIVAIFD